MDHKYMNCTRCELCGTAALIYSQPFIEYSILFRLLAGPLAVMGLTILSAAILKSKGIHLNTKAILLTMAIAAVTCNIGISVDALYKFFVSNVMPDDMQCDYQVFNPQYFIGIRNLQIVGSTALATTTLALALERTIATVFYRHYNLTVTTPFLGLVLVIIQILICVTPIFYIRIPKQMYPYSPPEIHDYKSCHYFSMWQTLINIISIMIFIVLWVTNKYRQKIIGESHLTVVFAKYDLFDNISCTKLMAPVVAVISIMVFSAEIIFLMFMPEYDENTVVTHQVLHEVTEYASFAEFHLTLIPLLFIILIFVMPAISTKLRQSFLCVSHLALCFPEQVHSSDTRSSSESSSELYGARIHWNVAMGGLQFTPGSTLSSEESTKI